MKYVPLYFLGLLLAICSIVGCSKEATLDSKPLQYSAKTALLDSAGHPVDTSHHYPGDTIRPNPGDTIRPNPGDTTHHPGDTTHHYPGDTTHHYPGDTTHWPPRDTVIPGKDTTVRY